jgi:hypothetical protein
MKAQWWSNPARQVPQSTQCRVRMDFQAPPHWSRKQRIGSPFSSHSKICERRLSERGKQEEREEKAHSPLLSHRKRRFFLRRRRARREVHQEVAPPRHEEREGDPTEISDSGESISTVHERDCERDEDEYVQKREMGTVDVRTLPITSFNPLTAKMRRRSGMILPSTTLARRQRGVGDLEGLASLPDES